MGSRSKDGRFPPKWYLLIDGEDDEPPTNPLTHYWNRGNPLYGIVHDPIVPETDYWNRGNPLEGKLHEPLTKPETDYWNRSSPLNLEDCPNYAQNATDFIANPPNCAPLHPNWERAATWLERKKERRRRESAELNTRMLIDQLEAEKEALNSRLELLKLLFDDD